MPKKKLVSIDFKDDSLILSKGKKTLRTINSPISGNIYSFKLNKEECFFIFEKEKSKIIVSFYPIDLFKPNNIITQKI